MNDSAALLDSAFTALRHNPADAQALAQLGQHYYHQGNWNLAAAYLEATACIAPSPELDILRGHTANRRADYAHAATCFQRVLTWHPTHIEARAGLGNSYFLRGDWAAATPIYEALAPELPDHPDVPNCLGKCYRMQLRLPEAIAQYRNAVSLQPTEAMYNELAWTLFESGDITAATEAYREGLNRFPQNHDLLYGYGFFLMHIGKWDEGFPLYEERWRTTKLGPRYHNIVGNLTRPMWDGKTPLTGKTVMVVSEQGAGDLIQFVRFAKTLVAMGTIVDILAPPFMASIMATVPWARAVHTRYEQIPDYDFYVPLMSCPLFFGMRPGQIPGMDAPYISAPAPQPRFSEKPTVGLVWAGDPNNDYEFYRSPNFEAYKPLIDAHPDIAFVALQVGPQAAQAADYIAAGKLIDGTKTIRDYGDTANAFTAIDLLISSCTSPVHLAGAMGIPACLLLSACPDWRWYQEETSTAWYPSQHIYRQQHLGEWAALIARVSADLPKRLRS